MKKFLLVTLLIFISCGPTEEEIQARIDSAIEEALLDIKNENVDICFLIVDREHSYQNVYTRRNPNITVTDSENKIVDYIARPKWSTEETLFFGNLNKYNDKKFSYKVYTAGYVLNIPKNARYLKIYADYGNSVDPNWWYEWDKDSIESFSETQFFVNYQIGLEGEDSMNLLTNEDFQSNFISIRDECQKFVKEEDLLNN